jgi:hypothetical protein
MNRYRTIDTLTVAAETVLALSEDQVRRRRHQLEALGEGRYRALTLVQFKRGEVFGLEGELPKGHDRFVEPLTEAAPAGSGAGESGQTSAPAGAGGGSKTDARSQAGKKGTRKK